jgi:hypothetical protein
LARLGRAGRGQPDLAISSAMNSKNARQRSTTLRWLG